MSHFCRLEERLDKMRERNPSVGRIFRPLIPIRPWGQSESGKLFQNAFSTRKVGIERSRVELLAEYSGGLPVLAHEIGDSVWRRAKDDAIDEDDCLEGIVDAAYSVGTRFIEKEVIQALQSRKYRSILAKIAKNKDNLDVKFSRKELRSLETFTPTERKALDNFLRRMVKPGGIVSVKEGERGLYRFPTHMHRMYFLLQAIEPSPKGKPNN